MTVLVTGGAGYVGSHVTHALLDRGECVVVLDNLSTGLRGLVGEEAVFVEGDAGDETLLRILIADHGVDAILHFAGSIVVPDSVREPLAYYANNTVVSRTLIETAIACGVKHFIYSSTATVYASDAKQPLGEDSPKEPVSPYARSKLMTEWMIEDATHAHDFRAITLRYFNVAGADPRGRSGQASRKATHLIKRAAQAALGRISCLDIFGTDYPTPDGTGVRDYIHVSDLANAHLLALDALRRGAPTSVFNCGYGRGASVREVIAAVERVSGKTLTVRESGRRPGDPPTLIADPTRLKTVLSWKPEHDDLDEIVRSALAWERRFNAGEENEAATGAAAERFPAAARLRARSAGKV
jgi:UDP-glucose 4-epimerase